MTDCTQIEIVMGFPLGVLSRTPPSEGYTKCIRISAREMRIHLSELLNVPITSSLCLSKHAPSPVGLVTGGHIRSNELVIQGILWNGMIPADHLHLLSAHRIGISPEFAGANIHYGWVKNFKLNGIALVLKEKAAFAHTWARRK